MPLTELEPVVDRYLQVADRLLPGRIVGFYVVGSTALGAYRRDRSDVDFVAVVDGELAARDIARLRVLHLVAASDTLVRSIRRGSLSFPGTCNGAFVRADDLSRPVSQIVPLASHTGHEFAVGRAFDVNPVVWKVFAEQGIAVRGPAAPTLGLQPEADRLRQWNLDNLERYWRPWAERSARTGHLQSRLSSPRWATAWGVLGPPRLHATIATGEVISKEDAGQYALDTFADEWHPIIREALAYRRAQPPDPAFRDRRVRTPAVTGFVLHVVDAARAV